MGKTADSWTVGGALAVTGASSFTGAIGATTIAGTTISGTDVNTDNTKIGVSVSSYRTKYNWCVADGVNPITFDCMRLYDFGSNTFKRFYVYNGSVVIV